MTSIMEMVQQHLGDGGVQQLSQHLGVDRGTTEAAVAAALPMLVNAASKPSALAGGPTGGPAGGLLSNLFGGNHADAAQQVSKHSGLDMHQAEKALLFLAPIVMARLMNQRQSGGATPAAPVSPASPTGTPQPAPEPQQSGLGGVLGAVERIFHKER